MAPGMKEVFSYLCEENELESGYGKAEFLYDHFSKTFPEYKVKVDRVAKKYLGNDWKRFISERTGGRISVQDVDNFIRHMWNNFWTDSEAVQQIGFIFDVAQDYHIDDAGRTAMENYDIPSMLTDPGPKMDWSVADHDLYDRTRRIVGVQGDELIFQGDKT